MLCFHRVYFLNPVWNNGENKRCFLRKVKNSGENIFRYDDEGGGEAWTQRPLTSHSCEAAVMRGRKPRQTRSGRRCAACTGSLCRSARTVRCSGSLFSKSWRRLTLTPVPHLSTPSPDLCFWGNRVL